jgi:transmembrane sensor
VSEHLPELAALGERIRTEQDVRLQAEHSLGSVRARVLGSDRPTRPRRSLIVQRGLLLAAAFGVLGAALVSVRLLHRAPLSVTADHQTIGVGGWIRVQNAAVPLDFSDGTEITLDPGSRARLEAVDSAGAHLAIETGHADVKVVPGRDGRWHLSLGPFGVDVTGTQFDIGWNPETEELTLTMREGKVMVSGCVLGDGRPLVAGERLVASCRDRRFEVVRARPLLAVSTSSSSNAVQPTASAPLDENALAANRQAPATNAPTLGADVPTIFDADAPDPNGSSGQALGARADSTGAPSPTHTDASQLAPDSWQALARAGKYPAALAAANGAGFDLELARVSAEDLSLLGDVARFGGSTSGSIKAYQTLRRRFPHTPLSANAAFAIGRIEFDQVGAFAEAARWFANYLAEQPRGPLAREALGRRMEALQRSGNEDAARAVAQSYQKSYPRGPHIRLAQRLLETQ